MTRIRGQIALKRAMRFHVNYQGPIALKRAMSFHVNYPSPEGNGF